MTRIFGAGISIELGLRKGKVIGDKVYDLCVVSDAMRGRVFLQWSDIRSLTMSMGIVKR